MAARITFNAVDFFLDDDEEELSFCNLLNTNNRCLLLAVEDTKRTNVPKVHGYSEDVLPYFIEEDFRTHYRVSKTIFQTMTVSLAADLSRQYATCDRVAPEKQVLIFLCYMSNQESMREVGHYFGTGKSTIHRVVHRVAKAFVSTFHNVIKWPDFQKQEQIARSFQQRSGLPDVIGALDGTHIRLSAALKGDKDYINKKGFPSIQLQIVCDDQLNITHAYVGWPGCTHDARVYRNSSLAEMIETGNEIAPGKYVIGDSAYPCKQRLIVPYKDTGRLDTNQRFFNRALSSSRQVVERCIGHIKGRFRRLREVPFHQPEEIVDIILSGCMLGNMCLTDDDVDNFIIEEDNDPNDYPNINNNEQEGLLRRVEIMNVI